MNSHIYYLSGTLEWTTENFDVIPLDDLQPRYKVQNL